MADSVTTGKARYYKQLNKNAKKRWRKRKWEKKQEIKELERVRELNSLKEKLRKEVREEAKGQQGSNVVDLRDVEGNCEQAEQPPIGEKKVKSNVGEEKSPVLKKKKTSNENPDEVSVHPNGVKELQVSTLVKCNKFIGCGTFGVCHLAFYRGITVVIKNFSLSKRQSVDKDTIKNEVLHEAEIIVQLGDHPGLPLLFGVQTRSLPYQLILQFHGEKDESLTLDKAAKKSKLHNEEWLFIVDKVGRALIHIHSCGFLHNDIKPNNIVLEKREDGIYNPVIIDFGKSCRISAPPPLKTLSEREQKVYKSKYPYIAPEIVEGRSRKSVKSDIFSFAKVVVFLCETVSLNVLSRSRSWYNSCALSRNPKQRPNIQQLIRD